jgi:antitoxin ParD1/3/4
MNVNLSDDLVQFVGEQTKSGGYTSQSEVVREGLRLLRARLAKRRALVSALKAGLADVEAGRVKPLTDDLLREIAARRRKQAEARAREKT